MLYKNLHFNLCYCRTRNFCEGIQAAAKHAQLYLALFYSSFSFTQLSIYRQNFKGEIRVGILPVHIRLGDYLLLSLPLLAAKSINNYNLLLCQLVNTK